MSDRIKNPQNTLNPKKKRITRERLVWIGITTVLLSITAILLLAPRVMAQNQEKDSRYFLNMFNYVFRYVQNHYADEDKVDSQKLIEGALRGLFESLEDPPSVYLTAREMEKLLDDTTGEFGGIGIFILDTEKGIEVARPIMGTPAHKAGILAGDVFTAVDGDPIKELSIDEVIQLLRGKPGTDVAVTILRNGSYSFDVKITRAMIEVPTVRRDMIPGKIGYMLILKFTPMTADRVKEAIDFFEEEHYTSLIIDLRSNPGGVLSSVVDITDFFLPKGDIIVSTESRIQSENRVYHSLKEPLVPEEIPILVLINRYSASAAEILTGAFKDTGRALIIGETSYGKGSVQQIIPLEIGGFKLTTSRYLTPAGILIDKVGIDPDRIVKVADFTEEELESYGKLIETGAIRNFISVSPDPSDEEIDTFIRSLKEEGLLVRSNRIEKDIRDEANRLKNVWSVYDLEYDSVLREAVKILKEE